MQTAGNEDRTPGSCRSKRWCFDGLIAHGDGEGGREAKQLQHGSSRSILGGLDPEFDSDCCHECKEQVTRSTRLEVVVARAGVAMELRLTAVTVNEADIVDFIMVVLGY